MLLRAILCLSLVAANRGSIAPSLFFSPENQVETLSTSINCYSTEHHWWKTVHKLTFQSADNSRVNFEVTRTCGTNELRVTLDNTNGRIKTLTNGYVGLTWDDLTAADGMQFYKCSIVICEPQETLNSTEPTLLTVTTKPTQPTMLQPVAPSVAVPENEPWIISFVCSGYTGYPNGFIGLEMHEENAPINNAPMLLGSAQSDQFGNAYLRYDHNATYARQTPNETLFRCKNYNSVLFNLIEYSPSVTLSVEYAPDKVFMSSNNAQEQLENGTAQAQQFILNTQFPVSVDIACFTDSNPKTVSKFSQLSGPATGVEYLHGASTIRINYAMPLESSSGVTMQFKCEAVYASSVNDVKSTVSATLLVQISGYKTMSVTQTSTDGTNMLLPNFTLIAIAYSLITKTISATL